MLSLKNVVYFLSSHYVLLPSLWSPPLPLESLISTHWVISVASHPVPLTLGSPFILCNSIPTLKFSSGLCVKRPQGSLNKGQVQVGGLEGSLPFVLSCPSQFHQQLLCKHVLPLSRALFPHLECAFLLVMHALLSSSFKAQIDSTFSLKISLVSLAESGRSLTTGLLKGLNKIMRRSRV